MRVLVTDRDATLLAAVAGAFAGHLDIATATGRDHCIALLRELEFDVVVACDKLGDYTGLELLSEVAAEWPQTLRIFAASPARLKRLESRLGLFELFSTLSYPIDARKLLPALALARRRLEVETAPSNVRHVVLEADEVMDGIEAVAHALARDSLAAGEPLAEFDAPGAEASAARMATAPQPHASVDESVSRLPASGRASDGHRGTNTIVAATASTAPVRTRNASSRPGVAASHAHAAAAAAPPGASAQRHAEAMTSGAPPSTSSSQRGGAHKGPPPRKPTVITAAQREAFQRALTKRKAAEAGISAHPHPVGGPRTQSATAGKKQRKNAQPPWMPASSDAPRATSSLGSLSDLARVATVGRPLHQLVVARGNSKRAALFIGGGVLAALAVVALNFERSGARESIAHHSQVASLVAPPPLFLTQDPAAADNAGSAGSQQQAQAASAEEQVNSATAPQPEPVNPDTAPPDPPPPPALERPGPMEPPSSMMPSYPPSGESE